MIASIKEATDVILIVNGESLTDKAFQRGNLPSGAQAAILDDSIFQH